MNFHGTPQLPSDLKSYSSMAWNENLIEGLRTIAAAILMAAMFLVVIFAGASSDPIGYPADREVIRR